MNNSFLEKRLKQDHFLKMNLYPYFYDERFIKFDLTINF